MSQNEKYCKSVKSIFLRFAQGFFFDFVLKMFSFVIPDEVIALPQSIGRFVPGESINNIFETDKKICTSILELVLDFAYFFSLLWTPLRACFLTSFLIYFFALIFAYLPDCLFNYLIYYLIVYSFSCLLTFLLTVFQ